VEEHVVARIADELQENTVTIEFITSHFGED
jgi:hypothetical protein